MKFEIIHGRIGSDIWANTRARIINKLISPKGKLMLDLGCGSGYVGRMFDKNNKVIFADISEKELRNIKGTKLILDAQYLPFKNNSFEFIICADVLEHIKDDERVFRQIYSKLKKGGKAIIAVPACSRFYGHHDKLIGHFRRYDRKELEKKVKKIGFKVKYSRYLCSLLFFPFVFNQFFFKSDKAYKGKSGLEKNFKFLLNIIASIESKINLPFGIGLLFLLEK